MSKKARDRRLDELATIAFEGSLSAVFSAYATELAELSSRLDTELGLASSDVKQALVTVAGSWWDIPERRWRARRVARRLRRAQTLAASLKGRAKAFPKEYARQFMTAEAAKEHTRKRSAS